MDRKVFDSMDISAQVEFINETLKEYGTLTKVCDVEDLRRSTIRDRFKKYGYELIDGQYTLINSPTEALSMPKNRKVQDSSTNPVNGDIMATIKSMQKELNILKEEVKNLKKAAPIKSNDDLNIMTFTGVCQNRNFRVDSNILKEFNSFCKKKKYSKYKKQDLLSQALKEFIDKYN